MANRVCLKNLIPVGIIAGISSGVQGLVGAVLSICVICTYFCALNAYPSAETTPIRATFTQFLAYLFQGDRCYSTLKATLAASDSRTSPQTLLVWMFLSFFFNFALHVVSVCLVIALWKWKKEKTLYVVNTWTFFSLLTCVDDMLLTYVFSDIYAGYTDVAPPLQSFTTLVVVFFAARGLFCWLLNLASVVFMINASTDLMKDLKKTKKQESSQQELINSWPSLNNFQNGQANVERTTTSTPPLVARPSSFADRSAYVRTPSMYGSQYPEYSALARWPSLAFNASQTLKEPSNRRERPPMDQRMSRSLREYAMSNNLPPLLPLQYAKKNFIASEGNDNLGFIESQDLKDRFIRLQSESSSDAYDPDIPQEYDTIPSPTPKTDYENKLIITSGSNERRFEVNTLRPQSLTEAILTRPPLKPVTGRPRKMSSSNV